MTTCQRREHYPAGEHALCADEFHRCDGGPPGEAARYNPALHVPDGTPCAARRWRTIVVDPPWEYRQKFAKSLPGSMFKTGGGASGRYAAGIRGAASHYDCMTVDAIRSIPLGEWADVDAHLYLWTTNAFLREAFDLMDAWGFAYKTTLTWAKNQIGMGFYFRGQTEHVLFGVRGSLRLLRRDLGTVFRGEGGAGPKRSHSKKPDSFYDMVETASPGPYLDVFARKQRMGWDVAGNEVYSCIPELAAADRGAGTEDRGG